MKNTYLLLILLLVFQGAAEETKPAKKPAVAAAPKPKAGPAIYVPPKVNSPSITAGPGSRGPAGHGFELFVLAPAHLGLTTRAAPVLYWFQAGTASDPLEITLVRPGEPEPILRVNLKDVPAGGVQRVDLHGYNLRLQPEIEYRWSIAAINNVEHRSQDIVASGGLMRVSLAPAVAARMEGASEAERVRVLAEAGLWYDAFQSSTELMDQHPEDRQWRDQLAAFSLQIGLTNVARYYKRLE